MASPKSTASHSPLSECVQDVSKEFTSAIELLHRLIPEEDFPAYSLDVSPATIYTHLVTLWMLTLQRLGGGKSMAAIVKDVQPKRAKIPKKSSPSTHQVD